MAAIIQEVGAAGQRLSVGPSARAIVIEGVVACFAGERDKSRPGGVTLKPEAWNPGEFARLLKQPPTPARNRAYQAQKDLLRGCSKSLKLLGEWEVFVRFCRAALLAVDPADVVMLDPNSSQPPPPDLRCSLGGASYFFELCEVLQKNIAKAAVGKVARGRLPLARIWDTLEGTFIKKLQKRYNPQAQPMSLLLYYSRSPSFWKFLSPLVTQGSTQIQTMLDSSGFESLWLFDAARGRVLAYFSQSSSLASTPE